MFDRLMILALFAVVQLAGDMMYMFYIPIISTFILSFYDNRECNTKQNLMRSVTSAIVVAIMGFVLTFLPVVGMLTMLPIVGSLVTGVGKGLGYTLFNDYLIWLFFGCK